MKHRSLLISRETAFVKLTLAVLFLAAFFGFNSICRGQATQSSSDNQETGRTEAAIDSFLQSHKYKLGIFRIQPHLSIGGGYDSNALYTDEQEPVGDVFVSVIPGASVGLKFGHQAIFRVIEDVDLLWYKELDQRRDIFNTTRAEFITGTDRMLANFSGGYRKRKRPIDEELDVPVENTTIDGGVDVDYTLTQRINLVSNFRINNSETNPIEEVNLDLPEISSHRSTLAGGGLAYAIRRSINVTANLHYVHSLSLETDATSNSWGTIFGVSFARTNVVGHIGAGYGQADSGQDQKQTTYLIDGNIDFRLTAKLSAGAFATRNYQVSSLLDNAFRLTTVGGVRISFPVTRRISAHANYSVGKNDYGNNTVDGQIVNTDNFQNASAGISTRIYKSLSLALGVSYLKRDTDITSLQKDRFTYDVGIRYSTGF
jgi:hypothetical protein